jgi:restriction system protein
MKNAILAVKRNSVREIMWMVRAGEHGFLFEDFKKSGVVAVGWKVGDLSKVQSAEEIRQMVDAAYAEESPEKRANKAGQLSRFRFDFKEGDNVVTYSPDERAYLVGTIKGPYLYDSSRKENYPHVRKVEWMHTVARDGLSTSTRNTLGAISTIFGIGEDAEKEILALPTKGKGVETAPEEQLEAIVEDEFGKARELIKDKVLSLKWDDVQRLVAGILRAMGYKTRISPPGPDRGRDVEASPDGLGLDDPRIVVEVKHRQGQMSAHDLRSFITVLRTGHKGLYVSTGGFTKDARHEAERADKPLTVIDIDGLVDLIIQYYDNFDPDTRHLLPLTKIYWPT